MGGDAIRDFDQLLELAKQGGPKRFAIADPADEAVLISASMAYRAGFARPLMVGDAQAARRIAEAHGIDLTGLEFVEAPPGSSGASARAVELVKNGEADVLMKGHVGTADLLRAALHKEKGLRTGRLLSHVVAVDASQVLDQFRCLKEPRLLFVTDSAVTIAPTLEEKIEIIQNVVEVCHKLGIANPKVAVLAALEQVNPKMPVTQEAAQLAKMGDRGQIKGAVIDGPLALDNAVSEEAARHKGIGGPVAGRADVLLVPDLEAGNILFKSFTYFTRARMAAVVVGALKPIVLTSRADEEEARFYSMALAAVLGA